MGILPLTGWPKDVFPELVRHTKFFVNHKSVIEFYIGRSVDPAQRKSDHKCDNIAVIYFTFSIESAKIIENALLKVFYNHPKCNNEAQHAAGNISEEYGNYIYIALWF